jgi:uncharacterized membrane protein
MQGAMRFVAGYDAGALTLLALLWTRGLHADPRLTKARAALDDPGQILILFVLLGAAVVGLVSAIAILGHEAGAQAAGQRWLAYVLATTAVSAGWFLVHTVFTFRYAHLYWYDDDGDGTESGGIRFPGTAEPSDVDFAYFAFTLGTSFAVSDPQVTETRVRREVIVHSIIAFAYNSVIIGMVINIFAGIFSSGSGGGGK